MERHSFMKSVTPNLKDVIGIEDIDWSWASSFDRELIRRASLDFPRVLFIGEDKKLSRKIMAVAKVNHIHIRALRATFGTKIQDDNAFDVIILNCPSSEFLKKQVAKNLGHVPHLIVTAESTNSNSFGNGKIVSKNIGASAILEEALSLVGARHFLTDLKPEKDRDAYSYVVGRLWSVLWLLLFVTLLTVLYPIISENFSSPNKRLGPKNRYQWDKGPVISIIV